MTASEAHQVMAAMKRGASFSTSDYMSGSMSSYSFDTAQNLFVRRERDINGGDDSVVFSESDFLAHLVKYFTFASLKSQLHLP